jgi:hypothetical protein
VPCNSCDGYLEGTEKGGVCEGCLRDWANWQRNEREANERWVRKMMAGGG